MTLKRQSMLASILPGTVNDFLTVKRLGCHERTPPMVPLPRALEWLDI